MNLQLMSGKLDLEKKKARVKMIQLLGHRCDNDYAKRRTVINIWPAIVLVKKKC